MSRISNVTTLREKNNLNLTSLSRKEFFYKHSFSFFFDRILSKKNVLGLFYSVNSSGSCLFLNINLFFRTQKLLFFRNRLKPYSLLSTKKFNSRTIFFNRMIKHFLFKEKLLSIKVVNYNKKVDSFLVKDLFFTFKKFLNLLFSRRFNLFIDFLKLTALMVEYTDVSSKYLYLLGQIFQVLSKKNHTRFLIFLKLVFLEILNLSKKRGGRFSIVGIKFLISGKLQGKTRSTEHKLLVGSVPVNTIDSRILFNKKHVYTLYGSFGFKLWVHTKKSLVE